MGRRGHRHCGRSVDAEDPVAEADQVASYPTLSGAEIDGQSSRRGDQGGESISLETPVAVVAWRPSPDDPVVGVGIPGVPQHQGILPDRSDCADRRPDLARPRVVEEQLDLVRVEWLGPQKDPGGTGGAPTERGG